MTECALTDIVTKSLHEAEYQLCVLAFTLEYQPTSQEQIVVVHEPFTQFLAASPVSHQAFVHLSKTIFLQRVQSAQQTTLGQSQVRCLLFLRDICFVPELCFSIPAFRWVKAHLEVPKVGFGVALEHLSMSL